MDIVVANAGVSQEGDYFADTFTENGELAEPKYGVLDVNVKATLNVVKHALRAFRLQFGGKGKPGSDFNREEESGGSLVLTSSATAYSPEWSLPVYSAGKMAVSQGSSVVLLFSLEFLSSSLSYFLAFLLPAPSSCGYIEWMR